MATKSSTARSSYRQKMQGYRPSISPNTAQEDDLISTDNTAQEYFPPLPDSGTLTIREKEKDTPIVKEKDETVKDKPLTEGYWLHDQYGQEYYVSTFGATSFEQLDSIERIETMRHMMVVRTNQFQSLVENIMYDDSIEDKASALNLLTNEFANIMQTLRSDLSSAKPTAVKESDDGNTVPLEEMFSGDVDIVKEGDTLPDPSHGLYLSVEIVRPGFGNQRDNRFYSESLLRESAPIFLGAKMYETDHRQEEKSTATWVSTLVEHIGFSESGGPIYKAYVHSPDFARRALNLYEHGLMDSLHCSILGRGQGKEGIIDGRKCMIVEAITAVDSVDWVTRAGAGGHAVGIVESAPNVAEPVANTIESAADTDGEQEMEHKEIPSSESATDASLGVVADYAPVLVVESATDASSTDCSSNATIFVSDPPVITENKTDSVDGNMAESKEGDTITADIEEKGAECQESAEKREAVASASSVSGEKQGPLSESDVVSHLSSKNINPLIQEYLAKDEYASLEEVDERTNDFLTLLRALSNAGKPFGLSETQKSQIANPGAVLKERMSSVLSKYFN